MTSLDGTLAIDQYFLTSPANEVEKELRIAQCFLIQLHELVHKKNLIVLGSYHYFLNKTPEKYDSEAGAFFEQNVFGKKIGLGILSIRNDTAQYILSDKTWSDFDLISIIGIKIKQD